ncbi:MAG: radical SAM protein [Deltaproteobacteria bacterium]|nr:radical SAM protein [Deltaproteobacteria bacterium]
MYKYLFGPVPSRRLGMSLGVDLVPHKVCSLNCIYCECGPTTDLTLQRKEYIPYDGVVEELKNYMENNPAPDYITFSGAGEPTLNSRIGDVLNFIKTNWPDIPVALLTNGSLFNHEQVRTQILKADLVLPSLDAASDATFHKIDRPFHKIKIENYIQGLIDFRKEYNGKIWLEILILPDINDSINDLLLLKEAILKINPDKVQLNTLDRPGTVNNLRPANKAELQQIVTFWEFNNTEIIASVPERKNMKSYREDTETAILETISRRPCTLNDLSIILGIHINEINKYLGVLEDDGKIETSRQERGVFYQTRHK